MSDFAGTGILLRLGWRRDRWVILACLVVLVALAGFSMQATVALYPTDADAAAASGAITDNPSITAIYGPLAAPTVAGVGILKTVMMGGLGVALLAFALVRRHTRREEESGRAELIASGVVGRRAPLVAAVTLAGAAVVIISLLAGLSLISAGSAGALGLTVAWTIIGLVTAAVTAVAVQLTSTTRGAGGIALGVLGLSFVLRAIGDTRFAPLTWFSYLGWAEKVAPYGANRYWLLLPGLALVLVLLGVADRLLHRRDLGSGIWLPRRGPAEGSARLRGTGALAWRLQRGTLAGWTIAYAVLGLVVGSVVASIDQIAETPVVKDMLRQMSGGQGSMSEIFVGTEMRFLAFGAAAFGIAAVLRARSEETSGRAELLLGSPAGRLAWLAGHLAIGVLGAVGLMLVAGVLAGVGASSAEAAPNFLSIVGAALATLPAILVTIAIAVLLLGWLPRHCAAAWAVLALLLLLGEFGGLLNLPRALTGLSPFDHLGSLPGGDARGLSLLALVVVAIFLAAIGALGLRRRDMPASA